MHLRQGINFDPTHPYIVRYIVHTAIAFLRTISTIKHCRSPCSAVLFQQQRKHAFMRMHVQLFGSSTIWTLILHEQIKRTMDDA